MVVFLKKEGCFMKKLLSLLLSVVLLLSVMPINAFAESVYYSGDVNDDLILNNMDLGLLMQRLNNWDVLINLDAADVNGDGIINNKDVGLLTQYLNNWDVDIDNNMFHHHVYNTSGICISCGASWFYDESQEDSEPQIVVSHAVGYKGDTASVDITLENNPGIVSMKIWVAYDTEVLELATTTQSNGRVVPDIKVGEGYSSCSFSQTTDNPFIINWVETFNPDKTNSKFVTLNFKIKDDATSGVSPIVVGYDPYDVYNSYYELVDFKVSNGSIEISDCQHVNLPAVEENRVEPTCADYGSYDSVVYCEYCGAEISRESIEIEPTGEHTFLAENTDYVLADNVSVGVPYKFGMIQENVSLSDVYYINGTKSAYYLGTTTDVSVANDVYLENTTGGYYLYTMIDGVKKYINMTLSGTHVNGTYDNTASTVYTYVVDTKALVATVNGDEYWIGTRNDATYTTVGPCKTKYEGFYCKLYEAIDIGTDCCVICGIRCSHNNVETVVENRVESTCSSNGYYENVCYCTVCNTEITRERVLLDKTPHYVNTSEFDGPVYAESNDSVYPFSVVNGVYTSTNKDDNSSSCYTITAQYNCTIDLTYSVSSEDNYDKLTINKNGSHIDNISGSVANRQCSISLFTGDVLTVIYSKDSSVSNGNDQGWFSFTVDSDFNLVPADYTTPRCLEDVNCYYCGELIHRRVGHIFGSIVKSTAPTCRQEGNVAYKTCTVCENNYSTGAGIYSVVALDTTVVEKMPHNIGSNGICTLCGNNPCVDYLTYKFANGAAVITGCDSDFEGEMIIPDSIDGYPVKIIDNNAFSGCIYMTDVVIPEGVIIIKSSAFAGCPALSAVTIPSTVTNIVYNAFGEYNYYNGNHSWYYDTLNTNNITRVNISDIDAWLNIDFETELSNPLNNGADLYLNGEKLTDLVIPEDFTFIGSYTFYGCTSLESVKIGDNIVRIDGYAFEGCTSLKNVTLGNKVAIIGNYAFWGCSSLKNIVIPSSVSNIGWEAFKRCTSLESVVICDSEYSGRQIGGYAFAECSSLKNLVIGDNVSYIDHHAFYNCTELESVSLGSDVFNIEESAFLGCENINRVDVSDISEWLDIYFRPESYYGPGNYGGTYYTSNPLHSGADLYVNGELLTELVIPHNVTNISRAAFIGCLSLEKVVIHNGVTDVGEYAFEGCDNIMQIEYYGSRSDWRNIAKGSGNDPLYLANIVYTDCDEHTYDGDDKLICSFCGKRRQYIPGNIFVGWDADSYGVVDNKDLAMLMQYLNGYEYLDINLDAADVNADGAINNRDYALLMQYLNGWDVELQ